MKRLSLLAILLSLLLSVALGQQAQPNKGADPEQMAIKALPPLLAATVTVKAADFTPVHGWMRGDSGTQQAIEAMLINGYDELAQWMKNGGRTIGPSFVIFNEDPATTPPQQLTCKVGYAVAEGAKGRHIVRIEKLPAMTAAVMRFQGQLGERAALRDTLSNWILARGYAPAGPLMEIYLNGHHRAATPMTDLAEIRWPVRRLLPRKPLGIETTSIGK